MEWFSAWWDALQISQQVMYCIAVPATLIFVIQTILLIIGFGGAGEGVNFSDTSGIDGLDVSGIDGNTDVGDLSDIIDIGDGSNPSDFTVLSLFTFQGIVAFFCVFGWIGVICINGGLPLWASVLIAFVCGLAAMIGVSKLIRLSTKLAQNGSIEMKYLLGETGSVYLRIPEDNKGQGKVTITTSERFLEFDAVTDDSEPIPNNAPIRVVDIRGGVLVVERTD